MAFEYCRWSSTRMLSYNIGKVCEKSQKPKQKTYWIGQRKMKAKYYFDNNKIKNHSRETFRTIILIEVIPQMILIIIHHSICILCVIRYYSSVCALAVIINILNELNINFHIFYARVLNMFQRYFPFCVLLLSGEIIICTIHIICVLLFS